MNLQPFHSSSAVFHSPSLFRPDLSSQLIRLLTSEGSPDDHPSRSERLPPLVHFWYLSWDIFFVPSFSFFFFLKTKRFSTSDLTLPRSMDLYVWVIDRPFKPVNPERRLESLSPRRLLCVFGTLSDPHPPEGFSFTIFISSPCCPLISIAEFQKLGCNKFTSCLFFLVHFFLIHSRGGDTVSNGFGGVTDTCKWETGTSSTRSQRSRRVVPIDSGTWELRTCRSAFWG